MKNPLSKIAILGLIVAALLLPLNACKTVDSVVKTPAVPAVVQGVIDCAGPSLFKVATFASLVPLVEHAIAQADPIGAIVLLAGDYGEAEIDCIVAYLNDQAKTQKLAAPGNELIARREDVTGQWLQRAAAAGEGPVVNYGAVQ